MSEESNAAELEIKGSAVKLSSEPLIVSTTSEKRAPLGLAEALGGMCRETPVVFLLANVWDSDNEETTAVKADAARQYRARHPKHRLIFLGDTRGEVDRLQAAGEEAFFANQNMRVSERIFRPLPEIPATFEAIYSARLTPGKRHELAAEIERVAYVTYLGDTPAELFGTILDGLAKRPRHAVLNRIVDGLPVWMTPTEVNEAYARAAVGLCLSAVEGAMASSMEYMLAGLPVVSTPSRGGRDVYFDPDYCVIADATPRAVREAVEALRARNIPRDYVRARTLAKIEPERQRFVAFIEQIKESFGVPRSYGTAWSFPGSPMHLWRTVGEHADDFFRPTRSGGSDQKPAAASEPVASGRSTKLVARSLHNFAPRVVPARAGRAWIDAMPAHHAYRCLPMSIANAYGWNILCPIPIEIEWNGGPTVHDLNVRALKPLPGGGPVRYFCVSHFGSGIATMHLDYIFRTDPGWNLLATGPFNSPKENAYPLTGIVDTDRLPFPFTMNWKVLRPGRASFDEGEPICAIFPIRMEAVVEAKPEIGPLSADPELERDYEAFRSSHGR